MKPPTAEGVGHAEPPSRLRDPSGGGGRGGIMHELSDLFEIIYNPNTDRYEVFKLNLGELKRVRLGSFRTYEDAKTYVEIYVGGRK